MLTWEILPYARLTNDQVYDILAVRQLVFVVEQRCPYLDADGRDRYSFHLLGRDNRGELVAYLRIVSPGRRFAEPSIGRVVVHPSHRGLGFGKTLMKEGIRKSQAIYPGQPIRISAQTYLQKFYEEFGFVRVGEGDPYDEDGIAHIEMIYPVRGGGGGPM